MQSFFTCFYSLVLPVLDQPILIERFFLDAHFGRKSTIKSEHSPTWRNKGMSYHSLHKIAISKSIFSWTILVICQACAAVFWWRLLTTAVCVWHLSQVFFTSFTKFTLTCAFLHSSDTDSQCQQCHIPKRLSPGDNTPANIECKSLISLLIAKHKSFFKFAHIFLMRFKSRLLFLNHLLISLQAKRRPPIPRF